MSTFRYVLIPEDPAKPMVERSHPKNKCLEDDDLRDVFKAHFAGGLSSEALDGYVSSLKSQIPNDTSSLDIKKMALSISVDTFALTIPSKEMHYGVSMYTDEKASVKNLRLNDRAIGLAKAAGAAQELRGDCFVSRYFDDDDAWLREDFTLEDCKSDAAWIVEASSKSRKGGAGGMASLSKLYDQMGGGGNATKIDAGQMKTIEMEKVRKDGDKVEWQQTSTDVEIRIRVDTGDKKLIRVVSHRQSLTVSAPDAVLTLPKLYTQIDPDATCWTFDKNDKVVTVTLEKAPQDEGTVWSRLSGED